MMKIRCFLSLVAVMLAIVGKTQANSVQTDVFGMGVNAFEINFVTISGATNPASGSGIVAGDYRMGVYEITNDQWDKFKTNIGGMVSGSPLNAYDENAYFTGTNVPTNTVSWYEAAQFVNYLNVDAGYASAYKFTGTQGTVGYTLGVWESGDAGYDASNLYRNSEAFYFLPTEDEWIKAAYWNGVSMQTYATKAGDTLYQGNGSNGGWNYFDNGYVISPWGPWDVGSGSEELNGTFDMMGNVWEWLENPYGWYGNVDYLSDSHRVLRGGAFHGYVSHLSSSSRLRLAPMGEGFFYGFRVASKVPDAVVPEPVTAAGMGMGLAAVLGYLRRRKR